MELAPLAEDPPASRPVHKCGRGQAPRPPRSRAARGGLRLIVREVCLASPEELLSEGVRLIVREVCIVNTDMVTIASVSQRLIS